MIGGGLGKAVLQTGRIGLTLRVFVNSCDRAHQTAH